MTARVSAMVKARRAIRSAVQTVACMDGLESRLLLSRSPAIWHINGDWNGRHVDDTITVQVDPNDATKLQAVRNDKVIGTRERDRIGKIMINGGAGNDNITVDLGPQDADIQVSIYGGAGDDTITGGAENDSIWGGGGDDSIDGGMGNDNINAGSGDDIVSGDEGDDYIVGGGGNDTLAGGTGNDSIDGGAGADQLSGGYGDDTVDGGAGADTLRGGDGSDTLIGGKDKSRDVVYRQLADHWHYDKYDVSKHDTTANPLTQVTDPEALKQWIIDNAVQQWQSSFGQPVWYWGWGGPMEPGKLYAMDGAVPMAGADVAGNDVQNHSTTNTQEANVDEADIVKTDGNYIYLISNQSLIILNSWPADQTSIVSTTPLDGSPDGMYLDGDKLVVISDEWQMATPMDATGNPVSAVATNGLWWGWSNPQVKVTIYNVADRTAPAVISTTTFDGSVSDTRQVDSRMFMVINNDLNVPQPEILPDPNAGTTPPDSGGNTGDTTGGGAVGDVGVPNMMPIWNNGTGYIYEDEASYRARLEAMSLDDLLPHYTTTINNADGTTSTTTGSLAQLPNLYVPATDREQNLFSVVLIDTADAVPQPKSSTTVIGMSGTVYSSQTSMYVTAEEWQSPMGDWQGDLQTNIYEFGLSDTGADYEANGHVPGWTIDSYSMSEDAQGYFRIATTTTSEGLSNNVFVMQDQGSNLGIVGGITGVAMDERIYSARFVGDRLYMVTFQQVDPLFTIDLSDPTNPTIQGVLEMPGYSSYLYPISDNLLLGFGRDADASGHVQGLQVSLFDVSDMQNPKLVDRMSLGDSNPDQWWGGSYSTAEWDHHAFSYFASQNLLALPVLDWGWWNGSGSLDLIQVDPAAGKFNKLGEVQHDGEVLRSVQIGDYVYSIGTDAVKVVQIGNPLVDVADVPLPQPAPPTPTPIDGSNGDGTPVTPIAPVAPTVTTSAVTK